MTVAKILQSKPSAEIHWVTPDSSVADAARKLSELRIGSLLVSRTGKTADGILSERDIVREVGRRGSACLTDKVSEMMTANPKTCERSERSNEVLARMTEGRFRHMPVVEDGELVGIVTIGDVVKYRLDEMAMENTALEDMIMGR